MHFLPSKFEVNMDKSNDIQKQLWDGALWVCVCVSALHCTALNTLTPELRGGRILISKMGVAESNEGVAPTVAQGTF
jgi:hypothetical protein